MGAQPASSEEQRFRQDPIVVKVYPQFAARIPEFLRNRRRDVVTMLDALTHDDFKTVARLGHDMKGAGASFGFQGITDIGAALEEKAGNADTDGSRWWVGELSTYLDRVGRDAEVTVQQPALDNVGVKAATARRFVLVEDNDLLRESSRDLLEQLGHKVNVARDGIEGLACILTEKPDVAIIDIGLPGMDGYEVARRVRAALGQSVLLVAATGYGQESDRKKALSAGFNTHLAKPFDIRLVQELLETQ